MPQLDADTRRFLLKLGATHALNALTGGEACHGYENACECGSCLTRAELYAEWLGVFPRVSDEVAAERAKRGAKPPVRQPWDAIEAEAA